MLQEIETIEDVRTFFNELLAEELNFHPDDDFSDYINYETKQPSYTVKEAADRNRLLTQSFEVCEGVGVDIYEVCIEIFMKDFYAAFPPEM
jgi:hypothetical protein